MAIKPILFNTEMVRAVLDGRKSCTRRLGRWKIAKLNADKNGDVTATVFKETKKGKTVSHFMGGSINELIKAFSNYQPGDILYVRETWHKYIKRVGEGENCHLAEFYGYKASVANSEDAGEPWKPSIHMPKEAARIWLKVTDVRIERLQKITEDEITREGLKPRFDVKDKFSGDIAKGGFLELWNSTIKKSDLDRYGWDANPWVWVIEFERCEKPEGV